MVPVTLPSVPDPRFPRQVTICIEVPRGSFVKRRPGGTVDFVSPFPCPFNYGSIEGSRSEDGDPLDAVVLGPRLAYGAQVRGTVQAVMGFIDAGASDPKVICAAAPLTEAERRQVERFFAVYVWFKRALHGLRRRAGETRCTGWIEPTPPPPPDPAGAPPR
jgi:inorganic pyrophosphatase